MTYKNIINSNYIPKALRVAHINASVADEQADYRIRLELRRNESNQLRWYNATDEEWVDSHDIKSVADAMTTLLAWYGNPNSGWGLTIGCKSH